MDIIHAYGAVHILCNGGGGFQVIVQRTATMFMYWDFTCFTATTHIVVNYE